MSKKTKRRSAAEWAEIVAQWKASGQSRDAYAKRHGLNAGTLGWWRTQLDHGRVSRSTSARRNASGTRQKSPRTKVAFAEVRVAQAQSVAPRLEVVARSGHVVRIEGEVDAVALRAVLQAVEQR